MNYASLIAVLERLDAALSAPTCLHIYGSAAFILLGEPERMSLDIDVAGPHSIADMGDLRQAAERIGLPLNPQEGDTRERLEWIGPLRLCLPPPSPTTDLILWTGTRLTVKTGSVPDLVASKLIRYDESDRSDIQFILKQSGCSWEDVRQAVTRLPTAFKNDPMLLENLQNLQTDITLWRGDLA
ncbi:MAG: hypothetical protein WC789_00265 [Lentisphaeria bacterium]|jgi:hypothetical protein